jgi:uncharacterized membrane protein YhaH (DUF805 family)
MDLKTIGTIIALCFLFLIATVWAMADVARKDFGTTGKKVVWWMIASIPFIGVFVYLIIGFRKGKRIVDI